MSYEKYTHDIVQFIGSVIYAILSPIGTRFNHPFFSNEEKRVIYDMAEKSTIKSAIWFLVMLIASGWFLYETIGIGNDFFYFKSNPIITSITMLIVGTVSLWFDGSTESKNFISATYTFPACMLFFLGLEPYITAMLEFGFDMLNPYFSFVMLVLTCIGIVITALYVVITVFSLVSVIGREGFVMLWKKEPWYAESQNGYGHKIKRRKWNEIDRKRNYY